MLSEKKYGKRFWSLDGACGADIQMMKTCSSDATYYLKGSWLVFLHQFL
jgi:hypothetical protein